MIDKCNSLLEVLEAFPNEAACVAHLEVLRWPAGIVCPGCGESRKFHRITRGHRYKCADCRYEFSIRKGTIFEESRLPLRKWFAAAWLATSHGTRMSSTQLAREIGVTQKTACLMLGRLSEVARALNGLDGRMARDGGKEGRVVLAPYEAAPNGHVPASHSAAPSPGRVRGAGKPCGARASTQLAEAITRMPKRTMTPWLGRIHQGDCLKHMAKLPAQSVGVIVTSPPYNLKNSTGNGLRNGNGGKWPKAELIKGYDGHDDAMPHDEYVAWQKRCLSAMWRVLRNDGAIFYNHKWRVQGGRWQRLADEITAHLPVRQIIIWQRKGGINFNPGYFVPTYEVIYLLAKPEFKLAPKANAMGDVWQIPQETKNPHPAPFPVELAERCITATEGRVVLDPFMGSGSTALAAIGSQREWIGFELSADYCRLARERIRELSRLIDR